jgi:VIT1/CCC1 family predicted Fe2+/Mn2+ transporter
MARKTDRNVSKPAPKSTAKSAAAHSAASAPHRSSAPKLASVPKQSGPSGQSAAPNHSGSSKPSAAAKPSSTTDLRSGGAAGLIRRRIAVLRKTPENPHETRGASVVRPIVFGATDGLVCNLSLIMGVAGAAGEDPHSLVIAGVAGLLAGGFSMAVGEYVSVRSQRELLEYQIELQRHQLHHTPQQERDILVEIYEAKGLSYAESDLIVDRIMRDPERAIDTFVREEIGLSAETMGSPVAAGLGSLGAFATGALVPLIPFILLKGGAAFALSIAGSGVALFAIGLAVSRLTHRNALWAGLRQAGMGGLAAAVTFGIGTLLGASVH